MSVPTSKVTAHLVGRWFAEMGNSIFDQQEADISAVAQVNRGGHLPRLVWTRQPLIRIHEDAHRLVDEPRTCKLFEGSNCSTIVQKAHASDSHTELSVTF